MHTEVSRNSYFACLCWQKLVLTLFLLAARPVLATEDLTVKLPAAGEYLVWVEAHMTSGPQAQAPAHVTGDRTALALPTPPSGVKEWRVLALDEKSGYVAQKTLPVKDTPTEVSFSTPDFDRVHRVRVQVTGAGDRPVAGGSVSLTDAKGGSHSRVLDATAAGTAEFTDVPSGSAKLMVTTTGGKSTTKEIDIHLPKGETVQTIAVPLPEVTAVIAAPGGTAAGTSTAAPGAAGPSETTTAGEGASTGGTAGTGTAAGSEGQAGETGAAPPVTPVPAPASGGGGLGNLVGLIVVLGAGYLLYLKGKNEGWTFDKFLARLGVQPATVTPGVSGTGSPSGSAAAPVPATPPVDPNVCAFCGQRKDPATGACACSLDAATVALTPGASPNLGPGVADGGGPRLIAVSGLAMGQIYPVTGEAAIGRDPGNAVPLAMDSTVSRRHAVIAAQDGSYVIRDQGSSNGTFVNGARVTESPLRPGDEVSIGGTRFRFEV